MNKSIPIKVREIKKELNFDLYFPDFTRERNRSAKQIQKIVKSCEKLLDAQIRKESNYEEHVIKTLEFLGALWEKYECKEIRDIYDEFVKIEKALFGLERRPEENARYRGHFVHMANTFIFGLRIISLMLQKLKDTPNDFKNLFKIENENLKKVGIPFKANYPFQQRLFYLWTLISTFHDIAIPIQHMADIGKGLTRYTEKFGWRLMEPSVSMPDFDISQLYQYFKLLSQIYLGKLKLIDKGRQYSRKVENNRVVDAPYIEKILGKEFDKSNHGVVGGFFMWKKIEEIFLLGKGRHGKKFGIKEFNNYTRYVLEQDIARAALAISLHGLKKFRTIKTYKRIRERILPIHFNDFPLTFLLILSDELQEFIRWEEVEIEKNLIFNYHPRLTINEVIKDKVNLTTSLLFNTKHEEYIKRKAAAIKNCKVEGLKIKKSVKIIGDKIKSDLERKLYFGEEFKITIEIYKQGSQKPLYQASLKTVIE